MSSGACRYCARSNRRVAHVSTYKHVWRRCTGCGTMWRENKARYPADGLIRILSSSAFGRRAANRIFPHFVQRSDHQRAVYASYGRAFDDVFGPPFSDPFLDMKRKRYLSEADEMQSLLAAHGVEIRGKSVLDVSGGPGSFAHLIRSVVGAIAVTEYDPASVAAMRARLPGIRVFATDLNADWTDDEMFDVVLYRSCVYFCVDIRAHLRQIEPRVSRGGYVFISTNTPTLGNALRWQYEDYTHNVLYHPDVVAQSLADAGFAIVARGTTRFYDHFLNWYTARDRLFHLWGIWHALRPDAPKALDARSAWVIARKA